LGRLREPPSALDRADIVLLTRWQQAGKTGEKTKYYLQERWPDKPILRADHIMGHPLRLSDGSKRPLPYEADAACAIGRPESFFAGIQSELGISLKAKHRFPDHHFFETQEITKILQEGTGTLLVTEKDAVKISRLELSLGQRQSIYVIPLQISIPAEDEKIIQGHLRKTLAKLFHTKTPEISPTAPANRSNN
jgi:tetraacyldisaccharide-1-P 4'-kinase